jgi:hypothetical protein
MMLGGVGFQVGLDEARQKQLAAQRQPAPAPDLVEQLKELKALQDAGAITPDEFQAAKRKVLGS